MLVPQNLSRLPTLCYTQHPHPLRSLKCYFNTHSALVIHNIMMQSDYAYQDFLLLKNVFGIHLHQLLL